ncbi:MAG: 2-C-methyl-D-erythritol 2,4-cyclodiphosphate synthase [Burkholderiaceae bacterium]
MSDQTDSSIRIGQGYDVHALVPGRRLVLGGVEIDHHQGLLGHSDADALLHAITDALLGALALGDIGNWFPDDDPQWAGADSARLLSAVADEVRARGWRVANLDSTVIAQAPRLAVYIGPMRERIAGILGIGIDTVSVKAKTAERLGAIGRREGIATQAVVLLVRAGSA